MTTTKEKARKAVNDATNPRLEEKIAALARSMDGSRQGYSKLQRRSNRARKEVETLNFRREMQQPSDPEAMEAAKAKLRDAVKTQAEFKAQVCALEKEACLDIGIVVRDMAANLSALADALQRLHTESSQGGGEECLTFHRPIARLRAISTDLACYSAEIIDHRRSAGR